MKTAIVSKTKNPQITKLLKKNGFTLTKKNPDIVVVNGGDGTILYSERLYPGIPKIAIKTSKICRKCDYTMEYLDSILKKVSKKKYRIIEASKVEARFKGKRLVALNEIQVRHKNPTVAIRFSVSLNDKKMENIIGDGVIVSTPFGSTGYYKSAGGKKFTRGIGLVFNNMYTGGPKYLVLPKNTIIKIKINKEDALLIRDNDNKFYTVKPNEQVMITTAKEKAKFVLC